MRNWLRFTQNQDGFTLLEILIAVTISGILAAGIVTTIFQIYHENERATRNMQVVQSVENAGFWISRDALSAQEALANGHSLVLDWEDWAGNIYQVSYDLVNGSLQRSAYIEFWENGVLIDTSNSLSTIARSIDENTNYIFEDGKLTCSITSTIGSTSENRIYQIDLRPEQPFS